MDFILKAEKRNTSSKGDVHALRRDGFVPAVIYGGKKEPQNLQINAHDLHLYLHHSHMPITTMENAGIKEIVTIKEIQKDPISRTITHIDLMRVDMNVSISVILPIVLEGEPTAIKEGGILTHQLTELEVEGMPGVLPESIKIDISKLQLGEKVTVGDIKLPAGITVNEDADSVVAVIASPNEEGEDGASSSEPELVGKKTEN